MKGEERKRDPTLGDGSDTTIATPTRKDLLLHLDVIFPKCHEAVVKFGRDMATHSEDLDDPKRLAKRIINYLKTQYPDGQKLYPDGQEFFVIRYEIEIFLPTIVKRLFGNDTKSYKTTLETVIKGFRNFHPPPNGNHRIQGSS